MAIWHHHIFTVAQFVHVPEVQWFLAGVREISGINMNIFAFLQCSFLPLDDAKFYTAGL